MPFDLVQIARDAILARGFEADYSKEALRQLAHIDFPAPASSAHVDLRDLLWCSIDNSDSKDLDQLTYAESDSTGNFILWIAIADVDAVVKKGSPIDSHAQRNTTSIYTPAKIFSMLPEKLSTNLSSLCEHEERVAIVVKITIDKEANVKDSALFQAVVFNHAKLSYDTIGSWLEGKEPAPEKVSFNPLLMEALQLQHTLAQKLRTLRFASGALTLQSSEAEVKIKETGETIIRLAPHNLAHQLIEEFMIAANRSVAEHFERANVRTLRRVVRIPKNWERIVEVAAQEGTHLPQTPDSKALEHFLIERKREDPISFPDLSLTIIKLLGRGEYVLDGSHAPGHFSLAIHAYMHSTAPNRRYPDLIVQRQIKSLLRGESAPYSTEELKSLAAHCTEREDEATRAERQANKSAAAAYLAPALGAYFDGIITGDGEGGVWVRIFAPAVEGKIIRSHAKLRVGDRVHVKLEFVDVLRGYIDFSCNQKQSDK